MPENIDLVLFLVKVYRPIFPDTDLPLAPYILSSGCGLHFWSTDWSFPFLVPANHFKLPFTGNWDGKRVDKGKLHLIKGNINGINGKRNATPETNSPRINFLLIFFRTCRSKVTLRATFSSFVSIDRTGQLSHGCKQFFPLSSHRLFFICLFGILGTLN